MRSKSDSTALSRFDSASLDQHQQSAPAPSTSRKLNAKILQSQSQAAFSEAKRLPQKQQQPQPSLLSVPPAVQYDCAPDLAELTASPAMDSVQLHYFLRALFSLELEHEFDRAWRLTSLEDGERSRSMDGGTQESLLTDEYVALGSSVAHKSDNVVVGCLWKISAPTTPLCFAS